MSEEQVLNKAVLCYRVGTLRVKVLPPQQARQVASGALVLAGVDAECHRAGI